MPVGRKMMKRRRVPRQLPKGLIKPIGKYAKAAGSVVWASNYSLGRFYLAYMSIFHPDDKNIAHRTWDVQRGDRAQYDLIRAAIAGNRMLPADVKEGLSWAVEK